MDPTIASEVRASAGAAAAPRLSVVMPAYNEAGNIDAAIDDVRDHVFRVVPDAEMLVIDDGSRDATGEIAARRADLDRRIRVIRQDNAGHGPALLRGLAEARGHYCLLLDSDRQIGLDRFAETWRLASTCDAVLGVRRPRVDPYHRRALSAALRAGMRLALGVRSSDPNVPYKLVRRDVVADALRAMPAAPNVPSLLLTVHLARHRRRVIEQPVAHAGRVAGESTLRPVRLARFCLSALVELLRFHRALERDAR